MTLFSGYGRVAARLSLIALVATSSTAGAETLKTVNGATIDSNILGAYVQTRFGKTAEMVTPDERNTALSELTDIYLLTTQDNVKKLADDPLTAAQLELQRRGYLAQIAASNYVRANQATDGEITSAYQKQYVDTKNEQYKARHILVPTQAEAQALVAELDKGADFAELAKEKSTGPSGPNGGDLDWFTADRMVKEFSNAVIALKDGSYSKQPVQTQFGWHIILREDSRELEAPPLLSVRNEIKQRVEQQKFQSYLQSLRKTD